MMVGMAVEVTVASREARTMTSMRAAVIQRRPGMVGAGVDEVVGSVVLLMGSAARENNIESVTIGEAVAVWKGGAGVCAPAPIFGGRCAGFFAHLRRGDFSFWFCKLYWFLGLGVEGVSQEGDAQVFCERGN